MDKKFDLVVSIVNRGHSDVVVSAGREVGAKGSTIMYGRGMSVHGRDTFMGISLQPEKEIILTLTPSENKNNIMQAVCDKAELDVVGNGICFSLPVTDVRGLTNKSAKGENQANEN